MREKNKIMIEKGIVVGRKILSVAERMLIELLEQMEDMEYVQTHSYSTIGADVREMRYDSEAFAEWRELRAKQQAIRRLRKKKYIKARCDGDRVIYELTGDGKIKALKSVIRANKEMFFDGEICLVSFDFPEVACEARRAFRNFLRGSGFRFVQGSVWSIGKNVYAPMIALVSMLKIGHWVEVYIARK